MKKHRIPLGPLILTVEVVLLVVIAIFIVMIAFRSAREQLIDTVEHNFQRASMVASQGLFEDLDRISSVVEILADDNYIQTNVTKKKWEKAEGLLYDAYSQLSGQTIDVLLLVDGTGKFKANPGQLFDESKQVVDWFAPYLFSHSWRVVGDTNKYIMRSIPITGLIDGEVVGYLLVGVNLKTHVNLVRKLRRLTGVDAFGIYVDHKLQSSASLYRGRGGFVGQKDITGFPERIVRFSGKDKVAYLTNITYLDKPFIQVLFSLDQKTFLGLADSFDDSLLLVVGLIALGGFLSLWILRYSVIIPAQQLEGYAMAVLDKKQNVKPQFSFIKEFHSAAQAVHVVFTELQSTNLNLEKTVEERTERLRQTEAKTQKIVASAKDGIITLDDVGNILTFNEAATVLFGYKEHEVIGLDASLLFAGGPEKNLRFFELDHGLSADESEVQGQKKDASSFLMDISVSAFDLGVGEKSYVWIVRDITERKEAENQLRLTLSQLQNAQAELVQSEKMASLGSLVAGVAHEINTPVGVGLTAATFLREQSVALEGQFDAGTMSKTDLKNYIETTLKSTQIIEGNLYRASDLVRSFKQVAVDQSNDALREINLKTYILEVLKSLAPKFKNKKHKISITGDENIVVNIHPGALSQIITNLILNSLLHAYKGDDIGNISINVEEVGDTITLTYSDDGVGMDEDVKSKIFDPFFTTKRGDGGSGLGMHILYNQVTQTLNGTIDLKTAVGEGAIFKIRMPRAQAALRGRSV